MAKSALNWLTRMRQRKIRIDAGTYNTSVKACGHGGGVGVLLTPQSGDLAESLVGEMREKGLAIPTGGGGGGPDEGRGGGGGVEGAFEAPPSP